MAIVIIYTRYIILYIFVTLDRYGRVDTIRSFHVISKSRIFSLISVQINSQLVARSFGFWLIIQEEEIKEERKI